VRIAVIVLLLAAAPEVRAEADSPAADASRHFQRAVELYNDGDVRGALVEFKKAYTLLPRASVLYNIGQTEYQLQEYAPALRDLERFLAETGPAAPHRAEVQEAVQVLRGRVGRIALTTDRSECEVSVDEQPAGITPLPEPLMVSIGRRRVTVACAGGQRATRDVEVPAGETVAVELKVGSPQPSPGAPMAMLPATPDRTSAPSRRGMIAAWTVTAVLAGATVGLYAAAMVDAKKLDDLRKTYPLTTKALDDKTKSASRLALVGDILAVTTVAAAGLATYLTFSSGEERAVQVSLSGTPTAAALSLHGKF
jgi:hypothetical protein